VPTRKQRRRRAKEQRHEYEVVYLDEEGNEVEVDPDSENDTAVPRRARKEERSRSASQNGGKPRGLEPPTWQRSARRALIMAPFFFAFLYVLQRDVASALVVSLFYAAVFIPFSYGIDKLTYRTQLKRLERR
jgi:hypothetical protein